VAKPTGFIEYKRQDVGHRSVEQRTKDFFEIDLPHAEAVLLQQAARCMDCGIPFCHGAGCPLRNRIPEFNDLIYRGRWKEACDNLHSTNNFPEITGRICPALCEASCSLSINSQPVLVRHIECQIAERGWQEGWIKPLPPKKKTGRKVAIIGSGPAGLAAAQQLARAGHNVVVFEKDHKPGGLLRYGIPDFKLDKRILDRRIEQLKAEGVEFQTGVAVGEDLSARYLQSMFDAICITMGAGEPRDLKVPGRELANVHFALEYLTQQNRINGGEAPGGPIISAKDKIVLVIGGGDTGSDCVGTAIRQGAKEVHQFEVLPKPPEAANPDTPWPEYPRILRTSSSHEEGCQRRWSVLTKNVSGTGNKVEQILACEVQWEGMNMKEAPGTDFTQKVDLMLLAMGFVHVVHKGMVEQFGLKLDERGNIVVNDYQTSVKGIFSAGDASLGASLVVRAINAGREAAAAIDNFLRA
jgi:glutamate synthase (NADPH/NADH) small chain